MPCPDPTENGSCPIRSGDFIPDVAVDPRNGNLYAVWMDLRFDGGIFLTDHDNIAFTMSTDGGRTWSPTIKVNQTPTTEPNYDQQAFTPAVDVASDGTVTVSYYDFRNNTASPATLDTDYFAVHCHASCANPASWVGNETRITPTSFDIRKAPYARGYFLGRLHGPRLGRNRLPRRVRSGVRPERRQPVREPALALRTAWAPTPTGESSAGRLPALSRSLDRSPVLGVVVAR